jgi:hypothetical protein
MSRQRKPLEVWAIVNAQGHFMTGELINGVAEFSPDESDAMQLDAEEVALELKQPGMEGASKKLLYTV